MPRPVAQQRVRQYIETWGCRDYATGIPDEVPDELMHERLAPSYKAIAIAILSNDLQFHSLGFRPRASGWYNELKRIEIQARLVGNAEEAQMESSRQLAFDFAPGQKRLQ